MRIDGNIECKGVRYEGGGQVGGGSGGSILINAAILEGEGRIDASGSDGNGNGGGGSGGRIAIYYHSSTFTGTIISVGGKSSAGTGAAGTIYQEDIKRNFKYLLVSNENREPSSFLVTDFNNSVSDSARTWLPDLATKNQRFENSMYVFDEVSLTEGAHLAMEVGTSSRYAMVIGKLNDGKRSDVKGYLHVGPWQTVKVSTIESVFPVNVRVYLNGALKLPPSIAIEKSKFDCDGMLFGIKDFTISETSVKFGTTSGATMNDTFYPRHFSFERVTVKAGGKIKFLSAQQGSVLTTKHLVVQSKAEVQARSLTILSDVIKVDETGIISLSGQGFVQNGKSFTGKLLPFQA